MLALTAAAFALHATAQGTANPTGPGANSATTGKAGEAYPNDPNAANRNAPTPRVVQKVEDSRPVKATKRGVRRATNATKRAGHRVANAMRRTGDKIADKLPPAPPQNSGVKQ